MPRPAIRSAMLKVKRLMTPRLVTPSSFYHSTPIRCQGFRPQTEAQKLRRCHFSVKRERERYANARPKAPVRDTWLRVAQMSQSATYTHQFFTFTHMPDYRLLLACGATFISTFALRAEPGLPPVQAPVEKTPAPARESAITFNSVHVNGAYIAMTFDDGPSAVLTPKLLDLLAARHIKATFFVIGENVAEHPEIA